MATNPVALSLVAGFLPVFFAFELRDFLDPALMASTFKLGMQPDVHNFQGDGFLDQAGAQGKYVGVIVRAASERSWARRSA